jgi:serine/threonine-protein kinase
MGVVYRAFDREVGEAVAIKALRPDLGGIDPTPLERFKQELRLARRITHRNVVRTYDLGEVDGVYYITMELVRGTRVATLIREAGRLDVPATLTIGKQVCRARMRHRTAGVRGAEPGHAARAPPRGHRAESAEPQPRRAGFTLGGDPPGTGQAAG